MSAVLEKLTVNTVSMGSKGSNVEVELDVPPIFQRLEDGQEQQPHQQLFRIINQKCGDERLVWDKRNLSEINDAKGTFDKLVKQGLKPYKVDKKGKRTSEIMAEFDPTAQEIIFIPIPAMIGG